MNRAMVLLFAIPVVSFVVIALYGFFHEMFKKNFILERRSANLAPGETPARRYADKVEAGKPRTEVEPAAPKSSEAPVQVHGV